MEPVIRNQPQFAQWLAAQLAARPEITQGRLALHAGVTVRTVRRWLAGQAKPQPIYAARLYRYFRTGLVHPLPAVPYFVGQRAEAEDRS